MDEIPITPLSGTLVASTVRASTAWSMSDDHQSQQKPSIDILAMPLSGESVLGCIGYQTNSHQT